MNSVYIALSLLALARSVFAQASHIRLPTPGTEIHKNENLTVQVVVPNSIMGSIEVGLVLSFQYCQAVGSCPNTSNQLGSILYVGKLNPQFHEIPGQPYENITVQIPDYEFEGPGPVQLVETRLHLIGGGPAAVLETNAVALQIMD